jgi:hypothetical protein
VLLLKAVFTAVTLATQQRILFWVDAGPSEESIRSWLKLIGDDATDQKILEFSEPKATR